MSERVYVVLRHLYSGLEVEPFIFVNKESASRWIERNRRYWKQANPHYEEMGYRKPKECRA